MYKNLPREIVDSISEDNILSYILDINNTSVEDVNYDELINKIRNIRKYKIQLDLLNKMPKVAQRSPEWYNMRQERLTASDTAQALGKGKFGNKKQLVEKKAYEDQNQSSKFGAGVPALRHGIIYEDVALRCYQQRLGDIKIHEFGLIPHPELACYGASPDGISDLGIMIEIKCPLSRIMDGSVPEQYFLQMTGQMAVCKLDECDYIECDIKEYKTFEEYLSNVSENQKVDHGIVIETTNNNYIYSPPYYTKKMLLEWIEQQKVELNNIKNICPWRLIKIDIQRIKFDEKLWNDIVPKIQDFWDEVLELKKNKSKRYAILDDD